MAKIELPYFGQVDFKQLEDYYSLTTFYNGNTITIDLNFENKKLSEEQALVIKEFLSNISKIDTQKKIEIKNSFENEGEAKDYINFYLDELDVEELKRIIDYDNNNNSYENQLFSKLKLIRVGLYPDGKYDSDYFGVFDYSIEIDGEPCNQLLVIKTNENGDLDNITWES